MGFAAALAAADDAALAHLGGVVVYASGYAAPLEVRGIFDAAYFRAEVGGASVQNVGPAVFLRLADLPKDPEDDDATITANGKTYRVREVVRDEVHGMVVLMLREVS